MNARNKHNCRYVSKNEIYVYFNIAEEIEQIVHDMLEAYLQ